MNEIKKANCLSAVRKLDDNMFKATITSPPYALKGRRYGGKDKIKPDEWVLMMVRLVKELVRVTDGPVFVVANGPVKKSPKINQHYFPVCEGLMYTASAAGICCDRPLIWHANKPPSRKDWFGNKWEYVMCFKKSFDLTFNWESIAEPPKFKAGGRFRQRNAKGERVMGSAYPKSKLARPGDVIYQTVGGGHMGMDRTLFDTDSWRQACTRDDEYCTSHQAPYPTRLIDRLVKVCTNPGDIVFDPFMGGATTAVSALCHGRRYFGYESGESEIAISRKRIAAVKRALAKERRKK